MIYTTCIMFYATFSHKQTVTYAIVLGIFLLSLSTFITVYYHYLKDPTFHQVVYAILTAIVLLRAMWVMEINIRPSITAKEKKLREDSNLSLEEKAELQRQDVRDLKIVKDMWTMIYYGLGTFLGGFFIWNLDNVFCSRLIGWRRDIGLPWGIVLEGHGWWYVIQDPILNIANMKSQAHHDRYWRILLHHLGDLASSMPQQQTG
jgi:dihydroceramidase